MPAYEIVLRFRDLTLSLCTTDAALADRTTMRWLESLAGIKAGMLASSQILAASPPVAPVALPTITPPLDVTSVPVATTILPEPEVLPVAVPIAPVAVLLPPEELPPIRTPEDVVPSAPEAISSALALEPEIVQVSASESPPPVNDVDDPVNDFEAVMDSMMRDLEANDLPPSETSEVPETPENFEAPEDKNLAGTTESLEIEADPTSEPPERIQEIPQEKITQAEITQEEPPQEASFEAILESVPQSELATLPTLPTLASAPPVRQVTDLRFIDSLTDLVEQAKPQTMEESLLLTSYYLTFFDATERFTLKHINNLLVKGGYPPVNHGVIEATIERGYLAVVPDLTGTAEMTEYQLSDAGQTFTERLL